MEIIKIRTKLSTSERETLLNYNMEDQIWELDTTILKHYNKALKQGWQLLRQYVYEDGTIAGGVFKGSKTSVTFRNPEKKKMSKNQLNNLSTDNE